MDDLNASGGFDQLNLAGRRVAVLGAKRSGVGVARALSALDATPTLYDKSQDVENPEFAVVGGWDRPFSLSEADMVVTSPGVPRNADVLVGSLANGLKVIGEIELAYHLAKVPIVGITGTNGKSTCTVMTWLCLRQAGLNPLLAGNIYGSGYPEQTLVEAAMLTRESTCSAKAIVAEISSFQLEWIDDFKPAAAGITSLSEDHLDRYDHKFSEYARTKARIFENLWEDDTAVIFDGYEPRPMGCKVRTFGDIMSDARIEGQFLVAPGCEIALNQLPFDEPHNYRNAECAVLLATAVAGPHLAQDCLEGLRTFKPLDNRLQFVGERDGIQIVNNTMCTNPAAVISSSQAIDRPQHLLIGGRNKGASFAGVGKYIASSGHKAYVFGESGPEIASHFGFSVDVYTSLEDAAKKALENAQSGDTIMLAPGCASMDRFTDFAHRGEVFTRLAKEWLER
ncbi:MAG TPA: UDP-N-acetylmuramoyl-L-alanine--D-glutamate ligase [Fimbriimonadaceae bacterium]|nr:UDP-N-acetylmuramoyl-L-alanine--D-glutamate ligase [Fimbriimonadaceae bacterium]